VNIVTLAGNERRIMKLRAGTRWLIGIGIGMAAGCSQSRPGEQLDATSGGDGATCTETALTRFSAPGPDGVWGTADDVIRERDVMHLDGAGRTTVMDWFTGAGLDGVWATGDDLETHRYISRFDGNGLLVERGEYYQPGADQVWGTPDDAQIGDETFTYDVAGRTHLQIGHDGAGADAQWGTTDDRIGLHLEYHYTASGVLEWIIVYMGPGDQVVRNVFSYTAGPDGHITKVTVNDSPGPDLVWHTPDDSISAYVVLTCSGRGVTYATYGDPGADATWNTADDVLVSNEVITNESGCGVDVCAPPIL
jgi:hypothetical protein